VLTPDTISRFFANPLQTGTLPFAGITENQSNRLRFGHFFWHEFPNRSRFGAITAEFELFRVTSRLGVESARAEPMLTGLLRFNRRLPRYPEPMSFTRITVRPDQMGGAPCVRGMRIPVATVVGMVADGMSESEIVVAYPDLEAEDVREAIRYAAEAVRERELPLAASG
jgi:uncharacterized protein (DUF433 family)